MSLLKACSERNTSKALDLLNSPSCDLTETDLDGNNVLVMACYNVMEDVAMKIVECSEHYGLEKKCILARLYYGHVKGD